MDGNYALQLMRNMSEEQLKGIRLLWFDEEQLDNLSCVGTPEYDKKCKFFYKLSGEEQGKLIERGLYTDLGDLTKTHDEFLDEFIARFEKALDEKMAEAEKEKENVPRIDKM